mgnify:FL=1
MVKLKNIAKNNNVISCDIFPEDSVTAGYVSVDINTEEMQFDLPKGYEWCVAHAHHAKRCLLKLSSESPLPNEQVVMWY